MSTTVTAAEALPLEEKAALGSGGSAWKSKTGPGVPPVVFSDGPQGVRAQDAAEDHLGIAASKPATCFPPAAGLSQSWDPELVERVGAALAREARHHGVGVLLGPGSNIKRDPRCGRNFEYFSEDPHQTGELGAAWVRGLQAGGVGASPKHFAANNAESDRMRSDSRVDARTLREIYLRGFEKIVKDAKPWTVMAAYNKVNGVYACQNRWLLTDVLRGEWGFEGLVVSDWGAVDDRVASVDAGLDLEMPGGDASSDAAVVAAVDSGALDAARVDAAAGNVIALLERVRAGAEAFPDRSIDEDAHHALAREAAARSIVLLKNDSALLPLATGGSLAVIGKFAVEPRFQGSGSSHVNPSRVDVPLDEIRAVAPSASVTYAGNTPEEAAVAAAAAGTAVVFLGLEDHEESEGFDREHLELPAEQLELLRAVVVAQPRTVVVLSHGGVVRLGEVAELAPAILDGALLGQGAGRGIADVLFGIVNPAGRTSETVPVRLQDVPSYGFFPGDDSVVRYAEGIFVGYRWYDARELDVTYPFGHGLSYTSFEYHDLSVTERRDDLLVRVTVANTGERDGREVVQVYVGKPRSAVARAPRELKGFANVPIPAGSSVQVEVSVPRADLAYWSESLGRWIVEDGGYEISVGASSRDIRSTSVTGINGDDVPVRFTPRSTLGEIMRHPVAGPAMAAMSGRTAERDAANEAALGGDVNRLMAQIPLNRMPTLSAGRFGADRVNQLLDLANSESE
ncbi:glycosyl hydrolase [Amycolatopsis sp. NBRC 101858]|uniref:glycoside hydrolase family 3 C-terminal domain-containing protein n=1 Tax=Amycolatopsis sp. NBRC 101858 TaxID=3032200 RepID=UPI0024A3B253|nr:glycoside hydrolase family 3 C-terminal domain-containing protein [Amycolatopsis sp. NBRC 101858]GLY38881.1 glycosyl hydrolase [Amycolatopsis sp. NBRC 101858]